MKAIGIGVALAVAATSIGHAEPRLEHQHHPMSHHEMMYGHHNHYYHHLYRDDHHHATATGGPVGGLPHRN